MAEETYTTTVIGCTAEKIHLLWFQLLPQARWTLYPKCLNPEGSTQMSGLMLIIRGLEVVRSISCSPSCPPLPSAFCHGMKTLMRSQLLNSGFPDSRTVRNKFCSLQITQSVAFSTKYTKTIAMNKIDKSVHAEGAFFSTERKNIISKRNN